MQFSFERFEEYACNVEECPLNILAPQWLHINPRGRVVSLDDCASRLK